jgi:hypothetical protein
LVSTWLKIAKDKEKTKGDFHAKATRLFTSRYFRIHVRRTD